jgi:hypothetical protein
MATGLSHGEQSKNSPYSVVSDIICAGNTFLIITELDSLPVKNRR